MNINKNHLWWVITSEGLYCIQINLFPFYLGSIYSTLAVAIERYMSVCHPHFTPSHCAGNFSIAGLIVFSIAFNIGRFLEFETIYRYSVSTHMHTHRYKCNYEYNSWYRLWNVIIMLYATKGSMLGSNRYFDSLQRNYGWRWFKLNDACGKYHYGYGIYYRIAKRSIILSGK